MIIFDKDKRCVLFTHVLGLHFNQQCNLKAKLCFCEFWERKTLWCLYFERSGLCFASFLYHVCILRSFLYVSAEYWVRLYGFCAEMLFILITTMLCIYHLCLSFFVLFIDV